MLENIIFIAALFCFTVKEFAIVESLFENIAREIIEVNVN
jgi:hypothetical protein